MHRSPGFITSNLIGKADDGSMIKEFEASHGTVADMWEAHLRGEETSINPLGMVEALIGAMNHAAALHGGHEELLAYTAAMREAIHKAMVSGKGTRDLCGPSGLTTEGFVDYIAAALEAHVTGKPPAEAPAADTQSPYVSDDDVDIDALQTLFKELDTDGNGSIDFLELKLGLRKLGVLPKNLLHVNK